MGNEYEYEYYDDGSYYDAEQFQQGSIDGNSTANNATQQVSAIASSEQSMNGGNAGNEFGQRSRARYQNDDRYIGMFTSSQRHTSESQSADTNVSIHNISKIHTTRETMMSHLELVSHADTCTIGANCRVLSYTNKSCEVSPYHPKYKAVQTCQLFRPVPHIHIQKQVLLIS
jgi:hypothetical protein